MSSIIVVAIEGTVRQINYLSKAFKLNEETKETADRFRSCSILHGSAPD